MNRFCLGPIAESITAPRRLVVTSKATSNATVSRVQSWPIEGLDHRITADRLAVAYGQFPQPVRIYGRKIRSAGTSASYLSSIRLQGVLVCPMTAGEAG